MGIEDDGLASRHTGSAGNLGGNALEAMQAFEMAMHVMGKYLSPLCRIRQRILETGDEDIVRVPCLAKLEISVEGDESGGRYIETGCQRRRPDDRL